MFKPPKAAKSLRRNFSSLRKLRKKNKSVEPLKKAHADMDEKLDYFFAPYRKDYVKEHEK